MNKKYKRGITLGAFDLCHAGHILMFKEAKEVCDYLIVGLQDDPSVDADYRISEKEGQIKNEPVMSLEERKIILEGIKYIDEVFTYTTEEDLYEKLKNLDYDVRILGADWKGKKYTGWDLPHTPYFNTRDHGFSTSELRNRVYEQEKAERELPDKEKSS
mgnify:CR=1 FL=1